MTAIGVLSVSTLLATACGDDDDDAASTATTNGGVATTAAEAEASDAQADVEEFLRPPDQLPEMPPIEGDIPEGLTIFLIATGGENDRLIADGMSAAADLLGWTVEVITTNRRDPAQANAAITSALQSGADGIVIPPVDAPTIAEGLAAAESQGVPTIAVANNTHDAFTGVVDSLSSEGPNPGQYGRIMAAATAADAERADATAHVGILTSGALASFAPMFDAFSEHLGEYCADCTTELIDAPIQELVTGQASSSIISALQRNPDLNYVMLLAPFSAGVRPGLDGNGFESVKLVGVAPVPAQLQEMADTPQGYVGWVVVPNRYDGFAAMDAIVRAVTGGDPTIHNTEAEPMWFLGPESEFDPSTLPEPPIDYEAFFSEIWGLSE